MTERDSRQGGERRQRSDLRADNLRIQGERLRSIMREGQTQISNAQLLRRLRDSMIALGRSDYVPSENSISRWVRGEVLPGPEYRRGIADALNVDERDIWPQLYGQTPPPPRPSTGRFPDFLYSDFDFEPEKINFYRISHWNTNRQLRASNVESPRVVEHSGKQDWMDPDKRQAISDSIVGGSPCASIRFWLLDDRESEESQRLRIMTAESHYREFITNYRYFRQNPSDLSAVKERIERHGMLPVMSTAPLSNVTMNATITSSDGYVLMMKRPRGANTYPGEWAAGPHETMNWPPSFAPSGTPGSGGRPEGLFDLAVRALVEEAGLTTDDYPRIVFSWFGVWIQDVSYYFFAHVKSNRTSREITRLVADCESATETDRLDWLPFSRESIEHVLSAQKGERSLMLGNDTHPKILGSTCVALTQLWRVQHLLEAFA